MSDWESQFRTWAKPASDTEQAKQENAERMIRAAISGSAKLETKEIIVRAQGSYRNNTNVPRESDVDIYVLLKDVFFSSFQFAEGFSRADVGLATAEYTYPMFKADVESALVAKFGRAAVSRGDKAFDIHETSYRVDADVVACFEHRRYLTRTWNGDFSFESGTEFMTDSGERIINWPEQQHENGVAKNKATGGRFKAIVRVLKNLRNHMADNGIEVAEPIPSFLIECLVYNAPNESFGHDLYWSDVRAGLAFTFNNTINETDCHDWVEESDLKYLFRGKTPWTWQQAHSFLSAAWDYVGFK